MPDTRGKPLPSEILDALRNPQVTNWLRSFLIQTTSAESIGRYPGNGSAQDDQYVYPDNADATFPYNFDYVIPSNFQRLVSAKLSFKIRPFRSYNQFSATATGAGTAHNHAQGTSQGESGHSHNHTHSIHFNVTFAVASLNSATGAAGSALGDLNAGAPYDTGQVVNANAAGSSGHTHLLGNGGTENAHTHPISISSTLGVFEDAAPVNPGITVKVDGVDVTTKVGGPFNSDQVEIDVTQVIATGVKLWHTLSLQPNQRVRLTGILRVSYYIDSRLAQ